MKLLRALLIAALASTAAIVLAGVVLDSPHADPAEPSAGNDVPVLIEADTNGAIVLDPSGELRGLDAFGAVRWRDRELAGRLYVSCLAQCPDAVGSGSVDDRPSATIWHVGQARVADRTPGVVLWARSQHELLAVRPGPAGDLFEMRTLAGASASRLEGTDPRLFAAPDDSRAVLVSTIANARAYQILDRGSDGWTVSAPRTAPVESACPGRNGLPIVYYDPDHAAILDTPRGEPRELSMTGVGRCATSQVAVLVQRFRQDSRSGDHTTTRLLDMSGATLWERVDPGFHLGDVDPTGDIVALPTDTGLVLLGRDGRTVERIPDVVDARFVAPGCLASLHADGVLTTRCRT